jgi:antitoxin ParD1/3/4
MHVSLTAELESSVKAKVESGLYNNSSEVIREALLFMEAHGDWINEVKLGTDQLDRGEGIVIESKAALNSLFDDIAHSD